MKIKLLLHIVNSKRDRSGNCYYFFVATDPKTGVWTEAKTSGGESNISSIYRYMGLEADERSVTYEEMPIRQFDRRVKEMPYAGCSPEDLAAWVTREFDAIKKKLKAQARKARAHAKAQATTIRQTCCRHCEQDIEGTTAENDWRDRGNNPTCPTPAGDAGQRHEPVSEDV